MNKCLLNNQHLIESRWREEITPDAEYPLHTYISRGTKLCGYIKRGTKDIVLFKKPMNAWSVTRRKFRDLSKSEKLEYIS